MLTNDSTSFDLRFRFSADDAQATLRPQETLTVVLRTKEAYIQAVAGSANYRLWVWS